MGLGQARSPDLHKLGVRRASDLTDENAGLGTDRVLSVLPELQDVLPGRGLRRGSTIAIAAGAAPGRSGMTSLLLALLAAPSRAGSWCAVVGLPTLGLVAAAEQGIALDRLALVPDPGPQWSTVVGALLDGFDIVVVVPGGAVTAAMRGHLSARARQRGTVLMPFCPGAGVAWEGADVTLAAVEGTWLGLGPGYGRLRCRELTVSVHGRGAAARPRNTTIWLPAAPDFLAAAAAAAAAPAASGLSGAAESGAADSGAVEKPRRPALVSLPTESTPDSDGPVRPQLRVVHG